MWGAMRGNNKFDREGGLNALSVPLDISIIAVGDNTLLLGHLDCHILVHKSKV